MDMIITFISAAGLGGIIGSVVTSFFQAWLSRKAVLDERRFREKKEAYVNFLNAMYKSEIEGSPEAAKNVGHWRNICDLVATETVRNLIGQIFETNPSSDGNHHPERPVILADLKAAMRADLNIDVG
tara:strand:+ start:486 stop:866 length:381 start_codon:yes stop_codon:yes gene_type:complete